MNQLYTLPVKVATLVNLSTNGLRREVQAVFKGNETYIVTEGIPTLAEFIKEQ